MQKEKDFVKCDAPKMMLSQASAWFTCVVPALVVVVLPCVLKHSLLPQLFLFLSITVYDLLRKGNMWMLTKLKLTFEGMINTQLRTKQILLIIWNYMIISWLCNNHRWIREISVAIYFQFAFGQDPRHKIAIKLNFLFSCSWLNHHIYKLDREKIFYQSFSLQFCAEIKIYYQNIASKGPVVTSSFYVFYIEINMNVC